MQNEQSSNINKMIVDYFLDKGAVHEGNTLAYDEIQLPIDSKIKDVFLKGLVKDGFIIVNADQAMWFDKKKWDSIVKELSRKYFMILAVPIIILVGILLLRTLR